MGIFSKKKVVMSQGSYNPASLKVDELYKTLEDLKRFNKNEIAQIEQDKKIEIEELEADQRLALKEKDFEIKHLADERIQKLEDELVKAEKKIAVFEKQVEMLDKIVDLNADVIDVKDLVTKLINKLPDVKINGNLTSESKKKE